MSKKMSQSEPEFEGNTNSSNSTHNQCKNWFFTWNNYPSDFNKILEPRFKEICTEYIFQQEIGNNGTKHIQGCLILKKKMRWTEFKLSKEIHWEKTKDIEKSKEYCSKTETKDPDGNTYTYPVIKKLKLIENLYPWQEKIINIIKEEPDDRTIYWLWENTGGIGKSQFTKYLAYHYNALFITGGKFSDLINLVYNTDMNKCNVLIFDLPRSHRNKISYDTLECVKNGMICNTKFETGVAFFNPPHVIVFSNYPPEDADEECEFNSDIKLSKDRLKVFEIGVNF